jgi:predicted HTH domain antitoxin
VQADSVQITISVPASLAEPGAGDRARVLLVLDAVRSERISWREGARALGLAPSAFLDIARDHGVPVIRYDESALVEDLETLDRLTRSR